MNCADASRKHKQRTPTRRHSIDQQPQGHAMTAYETYRTVSVERRGRILVLTLDRPDALNAVNAALHAELARIFVEVRHDAEADVVVLTGRGRAFCAGGDIDWMQAAIDDPALFEETGRQAKEIVFGQLDLDKPLICRLNGHATGLGASLALLCDIIIAQVNAKIGDPHVPVGLVAGDGGALIWPQLVGYAKARHYLFTGELMTAVEAERLGLITRVVPEAELDAAVYGLAEQLLNSPRKALQWTKVVTNLPLKALFQAHFDAGVAYESMSNLTADHQEAVAAFREKRKPLFGGR
jgi:enoyl-CoA hydratase/carnithine racemase